MAVPCAVRPAACPVAKNYQKQCRPPHTVSRPRGTGPPVHSGQAISVLASKSGWPHCHPAPLFGYTLGFVSKAQRHVHITQCWVFAAGERSHLLFCSEISAKHPRSSLVGSACHPAEPSSSGSWPSYHKDCLLSTFLSEECHKGGLRTSVSTDLTRMAFTVCVSSACLFEAFQAFLSMQLKAPNLCSSLSSVATPTFQVSQQHPFLEPESASYDCRNRAPQTRVFSQFWRPEPEHAVSRALTPLQAGGGPSRLWRPVPVHPGAACGRVPTVPAPVSMGLLPVSTFTVCVSLLRTLVASHHIRARSPPGRPLSRVCQGRSRSEVLGVKTWSFFPRC